MRIEALLNKGGHESGPLEKTADRLTAPMREAWLSRQVEEIKDPSTKSREPKVVTYTQPNILLKVVASILPLFPFLLGIILKTAAIFTDEKAKLYHDFVVNKLEFDTTTKKRHFILISTTLTND